MKKLVSIKRIILLPFVVSLIALTIIIAVVWRTDYNWMTGEQGDKILNSINENVTDRLEFFMNEPVRIAKTYANVIRNQNLDTGGDLSQVEKVTEDFVKEILGESTQISTIGYGNEDGKYIGIRLDHETSKKDLMLIDERTDMELVIYDGLSLNGEEFARYEGYDPRVRPWYTPAKNNKRSVWSEIYINYDEKKEATISILVPVFNDKSLFRGVVVVDVKLDGIGKFLSEEKSKSGGVYYITNSNYGILGSSEIENNIIPISDSEEPAGELLIAYNSEVEAIKESGKMFYANTGLIDKLTFTDTENDKFLGWKTKFVDKYGIQWFVITLMSEKNLMGEVYYHQILTFGIILTVIFISMSLGTYALFKLIKPIVRTAEAITYLSKGDWDIVLKEDEHSLKETYNLAKAFNNMKSQLKKSFERVKENEEKYRGLVENSEDIIYSIDINGRFLSVNNSFELLTGIDRSKIIGMDIDDFASLDESYSKWIQDIKLAIDNKQVLKSFSFITDKSGKHVMYNMTLIPILSRDNQIIGIVGTNHDITTLMEMEAERISSLSYVVSGVAHEINTPIGNCITIASYLQRETENARKLVESGNVTKSKLLEFFDNSDESHEQIVKNLKKGTLLVESFKKLAVNQSINEMTDVNIYNFLTTMSEFFSEKYPDRNVLFYVNCPRHIQIHCEQFKLTQIFDEIINNSFIHGFEGRSNGKITIDVTENTINRYIDITVRDDGVGVSSEIAKNLFTPFFSTKFGSVHSGLGLNLVYNLVKGPFAGDIKVNEKFYSGLEINLRLKSN